LGWFDAEVVRLQVKDPYKYKIPHTGWNTIHINHPSNLLMRGVAADAEFYFVHTYQVRLKNPDQELCRTDYDTTFTSAICRDNIYGVQFHPEKSHEAGNTVFRNFIHC
jgi:glutamine amidotransferase